MASTWFRRSADEHTRAQRLALRQWLPAAASFSPFWAERFRQAGVDPEGVSSPADLRELSTVRERDVRDAGGRGGPALVLRPSEDQVKASASFSVLRDVASAIRRFGTAGKRHGLLVEYKPIQLLPSGRDGRLALAYSRTDLDRLHRCGARAAAVLGLHDGDYLVSALPVDNSTRFWGLYHLALGSSMLAVHPRRVADALDRVVPAFRQVPATAVAVTPEEAIELAATLTEAGMDLSRLRRVVLCGPPPNDDRRPAIVEAWRAADAPPELEVAALWGPPGVRAPWGETDLGDGRRGFVTYPDLDLVEVADPKGREVADGPGELVYTSLGWHGTALLRYRTGELVGGIVTDHAAPAGWTAPAVVGPVQTAAWEPVLRRDGRAIRVDLRGVPVALAGTADTWQVELRADPGDHPPSEHYLVRVAGVEDRDRLEELHRRLAAAVGAEPLQILVQDSKEIEALVGEAATPFLDRR